MKYQEAGAGCSIVPLEVLQLYIYRVESAIARAEANYIQAEKDKVEYDTLFDGTINTLQVMLLEKENMMIERGSDKLARDAELANKIAMSMWRNAPGYMTFLSDGPATIYPEVYRFNYEDSDVFLTETVKEIRKNYGSILEVSAGVINDSGMTLNRPQAVVGTQGHLFHFFSRDKAHVAFDKIDRAICDLISTLKQLRELEKIDSIGFMLNYSLLNTLDGVL